MHKQIRSSVRQVGLILFFLPGESVNYVAVDWVQIIILFQIDTASLFWALYKIWMARLFFDMDKNWSVPYDSV